MNIVAFLSILFLVECASALSVLPDIADSDRFDEEAYMRMLPDLSRRREDPETDEKFGNDEEIDSDGDKFSLTSNLDGDVKNLISYNGIDINKLPANYHKTITITKKVGNKTVTISNVTIDKTTDPKTGAVSISITQSSNYGGVATKQCSTSSPCTTGMYCRKLLYGDYCSKCSNISEGCTSNEQCCGSGTSGSLCVRGTCQTGFKKGETGTLCKYQRYCKAGHCCARKFMQPNGECQKLAKKGERCAVSLTELSLIMHGGRCPCTRGLVCSSGSWFEGLFGDSMDTILGGKKRHRWASSFFDDEDDEDFEDLLE